MELRIEYLGNEHMAPYAALSRIEYGESAAVANERHLRWKFLENPQGRSTGVHLYEGGELVGRMVALARGFVHRHKRYCAAHVVDLLVHPRIRGMSALLQLVQGLRSIQGFDFYLIMAPNPAGAAVWEKFWKMPACFELDVSVAPLRPAALLQSRRKLPSWFPANVVDKTWGVCMRTGNILRRSFGSLEIDRQWPSSSELEKLSRADWGDRVTGIRSPEYLNWRYKGSPIFSYEPFFLRRKGDLLGYVIMRRDVHDGLDCLFVVDSLALPDESGIAWRCVTMPALSSASADGAHMGMVMGNSRLAPVSELSTVPFLSVAKNLLPRKTTVYAEWITTPAFDISRENMYLTLGDGDVI